MVRFESLALAAALFGRAGATGCHPAYVSGASYQAGDVVSAVTMMGTTSATHNYECVSGPYSLFCSQTGFEPVGIYSSTAWIKEGAECAGTASVTSPVSGSTPVGPIPAAWSGVGCPAAFSSGTEYSAGNTVTVARTGYGMVYECKPYPFDQWCDMIGYEPGASLDWAQAWTELGSCSGTIAPTSSPVFVALPNLGGCPREWELQVLPDEYEEGDLVSSDGLVYGCRAWPESRLCGQEGYKPDTNPATPGAWGDAWTLAGRCSGEIAPTGSPTFDALEDVGACPDEWMRGSNVAYEEGDMVSVAASETPVRKVVYRCKAWPFSGHCGQLSPAQYGGHLGWTLAGSCDGSVGPTASPSFEALSVDASGCPEEWSASRSDYEAGDRVAYSVSDSPARKVVYRCRDFPHSGYCNQGVAYEPTTRFAAMAWTPLGACVGTMAPTGSPVAYSGTCTYRRCRKAEVAGRQEEQCGDADVDAWSASEMYSTGDVVRVGVKRFRCREWPNSLWCRVAAYTPEPGPGIWRQAWAEDGACPVMPSSRSSSQPSASPSVGCLDGRIGSERLISFLEGKTFTIRDPNTGYDYTLSWSAGSGSLVQDYGQVVSLGEFVGIQANADVAVFENGDGGPGIDGCPQPRSATVAFEEDCMASEIAVTDVMEPSICVYRLTISGFCVCQ